MAWGSNRNVSHHGLLFNGGVPFIQSGMVKAQDEGKCVKVSAAKTVALCDDDDAFDGFVSVVEDDGRCTVQINRFITATYSGQDLVPGRRYLCAGVAGVIKSGSTPSQGTITVTGVATLPTVGQQIICGPAGVPGGIHTFVATRLGTGHIEIGETVDECVANIEYALNEDSAHVTAVADLDTDTVVVTAKVPGPIGDSYVFTTSGTGTSVDGAGTLGTTTAGSDDHGREYLVTDVDTVNKTATFLHKQ